MFEMRLFFEFVVDKGNSVSVVVHAVVVELTDADGLGLCQCLEVPHHALSRLAFFAPGYLYFAHG